MEERAEIPEELGNLIASGSRRHFQAYRRVFLVWGIAVPVAGIGAEILARIGAERWIPALWLAVVTGGIIVSIIASRLIQRRTGVRPALLGYHAALWLGGTGCILALFLIGAFGKIFSLAYLSALSLPVIALCALVSGALFRSRGLYAASACFLLGAIPAVIFPAHGSLIQAVLMGVALLMLGARRDG